MSNNIESDYVQMGDATGSSTPLNLDDPNLSQEDKDLRLAIALQQQENAAALSNAKKKKEAAKKSNMLRSGRSGVGSRLAAIRDKDHGMLSVPSSYDNENAYKNELDYLPPGNDAQTSQESSDASLARQLQNVEVTSISAAVETDKLAKLISSEATAQKFRTERSGRKKL